MSRAVKPGAAKLLQHLVEDPAARLAAAGEGGYGLSGGAGAPAGTRISEKVARLLVSRGLLYEAEPGRLAATSVARAWLRRQADPDRPFRRQHGALESARLREESGDTTVLVNTEESPVAALARRSAKNGEPWLADDMAAAAERLRRDFEIGRLQPRVTANWSASVNRGRRDGNAAGLTDLTDMALAGRLRLDRALHAVGPEFSGLLVDVCCFLKGLETVERERQWPARSAKLVLRLALASLARHYGLRAAATGGAAGHIRHWGTEDFRPEVT